VGDGSNQPRASGPTRVKEVAVAGKFPEGNIGPLDGMECKEDLVKVVRRWR
jgi:hypothetical protein